MNLAWEEAPEVLQPSPVHALFTARKAPLLVAFSAAKVTVLQLPAVKGETLNLPLLAKEGTEVAERTFSG